jgi:hypothetical protein
MLRLLPVLLLACLCCGCFVFDELEAGEKMMEQNSPKKPGAEAAAATAAAGDAEKPGPPTGQAWWSGARSLNAPAEAKPGDPDAPVRCKLGGGTRFMRRGDCLSQGGREA